MHTTACISCRQARVKCQRQSRGQDMDETCDRCRAQRLDCQTVKRRLGRQPGVKNKKRRIEVISEPAGPKLPDQIPNPLHELAQAASSDGDRERFSPDANDPILSTHDSKFILSTFSRYTAQVTGGGDHDGLQQRIEDILSFSNTTPPDQSQSSVFSGRTDMSRPDASPEDDPIALQLISLAEAQRLYDLFLRYITNGSMYFDDKLHTLGFIRLRSTFLLSVVLAVASTYTPFCDNFRLHHRLIDHALRLETKMRSSHFKSVEIVQGFLLLASWTEMPTQLSRDKTWLYINHAIGLSIELRMDARLPYSIEVDPAFETHGNLMVRSAHRVCRLLFIHDRNMAMVSGRYPVLPDTQLFSGPVLAKWGKDINATRFDAPICASVSLRKLINEVQYYFAALASDTFETDRDFIDKRMAEWREQWAVEITSTSEYDIIARFSTLIIALSLLTRDRYSETGQAGCKRYCETLAFDVCCASIRHYKTWTGLLNSATFDTCMVAYCAMYTVKSIRGSVILSDWAVFRIATLQELVSELQRQAGQRHAPRDADQRTVVDAMSQQLDQAIRALLSRPPDRAMTIDAPSFPANDDPLPFSEPPFDLQIPLFDDLSQLLGTTMSNDWDFPAFQGQSFESGWWDT